MTDAIYINSSNQTSSTSTNFRVDFTTTYNPAGCEIALSRLLMYNAIANIRTTLGNTSFNYTWPDNTGTFQQYTVNLLPSTNTGIYASIEDINNIMQTVMFNNGHYLISNGTPIYYLSMAAVAYANRFAISNTVIPTALPTGFTKPTVGTFSNWVFPAIATFPRIFIPTTSLQTTLGFSSGFYPVTVSAVSNISVSTSTPQITDITSLLVTCSFVGYSPFSTIFQRLASVPINNGYNSYITFNPPQLSWLKTIEGNVRSIEVNLCDQNGNNLNTSLLDTSGIIMELQVRKIKS
jgi:hypothetical protein